MAQEEKGKTKIKLEPETVAGLRVAKEQLRILKDAIPKMKALKMDTVKIESDVKLLKSIEKDIEQIAE